jgi:hypothetical protein
MAVCVDVDVEAGTVVLVAVDGKVVDVEVEVGQRATDTTVIVPVMLGWNSQWYG